MKSFALVHSCRRIWRRSVSSVKAASNQKKLVAALSLAALRTLNSRLAFCCLFSSSLTTLHSKGLGFLNGVLDACLDCDKGRPPTSGVFALILLMARKIRNWMHFLGPNKKLIVLVHVGSLLFSLYIISVFCSFQVMRTRLDAVSNVEKIVKSFKRKTNNIVQCKRTFNEGSFTWPHYRISSGDSKARFLFLAPKIPGSVTSSYTVLMLCFDS